MTAPLGAVIAFLSNHGWTERAIHGTGRQFAPPSNLEQPEGFCLYIPAEEGMPGSAAALSAVVRTLAQLYGESETGLAASLLRAETLVSLRLMGGAFADGSMPFPAFEAMIERLKRTLLHTASFVLSESHTIDTVPEEAYTYLNNCRFLQTERGSYIARVRLPSESALTTPSLFGEELVKSTDVNERLVDIVTFVIDNVLPAGARPFDEDVFEPSLDLINIDVLRDLKDLFQRSGASEIVFEFSVGQVQGPISTGQLTRARLARFDDFISFAANRLAADREIDVIGRIVELRSRRPDRRRNHVLVATTLDGRDVFVGVSMTRRDYSTATTAHDRNRLVRVRGNAKQLKTQWRITRLLVFEDIDAPTSPTVAPEGHTSQ